ncbi:MAG: hypothetical protein M5U33_03375 [Pseudorhodoplanes sp.]|nr:hypothetical protein [Pseudorhodoplanes sp.]
MSRSGYTGEDGYEISCKATRVRAIAERLLGEPEVKPIGLGARDSLRPPEAGLCLYGHDIDASTSPGGGGARLVRSKAAARGGRLSEAPPHPAQLAEGPDGCAQSASARGRAPAARGPESRAADGAAISRVTSGRLRPHGREPSPVAMERGARHIHAGHAGRARRAAKELAAQVVPLPAFIAPPCAR